MSMGLFGLQLTSSEAARVHRRETTLHYGRPSKIYCAAFIFGMLAAAVVPAHSASSHKTLKAAFTSSLINSKVASSAAAISKVAANDTDAPINNAVLKVVASLQAGNGQTFSDVLIDTGSAILWLGGETLYEPGPNTQTTNETFSIGYGAGGASGIAYTDKVTIGAAVANSQIIGAANHTTGFKLVKPIDGILGLGPSGSNSGEVSGHDTTPTFVESLLSEGSIDAAMFGIYVNGLAAASGNQIGQGEITFGGIDDSRTSGEMVWLRQNEPVNFHWEFNVSSFSFGDMILVNDTEPGRTDTGVLEIGLPSDAFFSILHSFPGAGLVPNGTFIGYLTFPLNASASSLPSMTFGLSDQTFDITASQYLIPTGLYDTLGLDATGALYTWVTSAGFGTFMFGQKWLESVYTGYDMTGHRVGFARLA